MRICHIAMLAAAALLGCSTSQTDTLPSQAAAALLTDGDAGDGGGDPSVCGDDLCAADETFDDCPIDCPAPPDQLCGNGTVDYDDDEECDDGNTVNGDGCDDACHFEACGGECPSVSCNVTEPDICLAADQWDFCDELPDGTPCDPSAALGLLPAGSR